MIDVRNKPVVVVGLGKSGLAAVELLLNHGARVTAIDSKPTPEMRARLEALGVDVKEHVEASFSGASLIVQEQPFVVTMPGEKPQVVKCRMRSLGCSPCTGAIRSDADSVPKIIQELISVRQSERQLRIIDHDQDGSMELKKREGYF